MSDAHANIDLAGRGAASVLLEFDIVSKHFYKDGHVVKALDGLRLTVHKGEFLVVVGPSGSGKSTLLNLAAGLITPDAGEVRYGGRRVEQVNTAVGYVTQHDTLLPWRTVKDNIGLALELHGVSRSAREATLRQEIAGVGLSDFADHYPNELSGGMRKRAILARTTIYRPPTILMDEPFGDLDPQLKLVLQLELLRIWERSQQTIVFVTHDLVEALTLADRVVVLSARPGHVEHVQVVDLPRPRHLLDTRFGPRFAELHRSLWDRMVIDVDRRRVEG